MATFGVRWGLRSLASLGLILALGMPETLADPLYTVTDMGTEGIYSAINNRGQAIGMTGYAGSQNTRGLLYSDGKVTDLGTSFLPKGINDSGQIVGVNVTSSGNQVGVRDADGTMRILGPYVGNLGYNLAINNPGQVVVGGYYETRIYAADGKSSSLYDYKEPLSSIAGISDSGRIAGTTYLKSLEHTAIVYTGTDGMSHVYGPSNGVGGIATYAISMSHNGLILGNRGDITSIDTGDTTYTGTAGALGINVSGMVVGSDGLQGALLWDGTRLLNLNQLIPPASGIYLNDALAINDQGQILATGQFDFNPDVASGGYAEHTFLLTPVNTPEPSTLIVLIVGFVAISFFRMMNFS